MFCSVPCVAILRQAAAPRALPRPPHSAYYPNPGTHGKLQQDFQELLTRQLAYHVWRLQVKSRRPHLSRAEPGNIGQGFDLPGLSGSRQFLRRLLVGIARCTREAALPTIPHAAAAIPLQPGRGPATTSSRSHRLRIPPNKLIRAKVARLRSVSGNLESPGGLTRRDSRQRILLTLDNHNRQTPPRSDSIPDREKPEAREPFRLGVSRGFIRAVPFPGIFFSPGIQKSVPHHPRSRFAAHGPAVGPSCAWLQQPGVSGHA